MLRSDVENAFLCEAFNCKPCYVRLEKFSNEEICEMIKKVHEGAYSPIQSNAQKVDKKVSAHADDKLKPPEQLAVKQIDAQATVHKSVQQNDCSVVDRDSTHRADDVFKPPLPMPVKHCEVQAIDHERK